MQNCSECFTGGADVKDELEDVGELEVALDADEDVTLRDKRGHKD